MSGTADRKITYVVTDAGIHIELPVVRSRPKLVFGGLALATGLGLLAAEFGFMLYVVFTSSDFLTGVAVTGMGLLFVAFRSVPALLTVGLGVDLLWGRMSIDLTGHGLRTARLIGRVRVPVPAASLHPRQIGTVDVGRDYLGRPFLGLGRRHVSSHGVVEPPVPLGAGFLQEDEATALRNRLVHDLGLADASADGSV